MNSIDEVLIQRALENDGCLSLYGADLRLVANRPWNQPAFSAKPAQQNKVTVRPGLYGAAAKRAANTKW